MIFFDIETISNWIVVPEKYTDKWNFMPEFNKILCISLWYILNWDYKIKTLSWNEKEIIEEFIKIIWDHVLCGFNVKNFDIPFIIKRAMALGIKIPYSLKYYWKKPWEVSNVLDLYEVYKSIWSTSADLNTVSQHLGIESSKWGWIDGSLVQEFYDQWRTEEIIKYCEEDVRCTMDVYRRFVELNFI